LRAHDRSCWLAHCSSTDDEPPSRYLGKTSYPRKAVSDGSQIQHGRCQRSAGCQRLSPWPPRKRSAFTGLAMRHLLRDMRFGLRLLLKNPGFTAVTVLTLALGIAATTAIFSVVHATFFAPLPYRDADRLVMVWSQREGGGRNSNSPADYLDFKRETSVFEDLNAWTGASSASGRAGRQCSSRPGRRRFRNYLLLPRARRALGFLEKPEASFFLVGSSWRTCGGCDVLRT
jgi:hypothetical protein